MSIIVEALIHNKCVAEMAGSHLARHALASPRLDTERKFATFRRTFRLLALFMEHLPMIVIAIEACADYLDELNAHYIVTASAILTAAYIEDSDHSTGHFNRYLIKNGPTLGLDCEQLGRAVRFVHDATNGCISPFGLRAVPSRYPRSLLGSYERYDEALQPHLRAAARRDERRDLANAWRRAVAEATLRRADRARKAAAATSLQLAWRRRLARLGATPTSMLD